MNQLVMALRTRVTTFNHSSAMQYAVRGPKKKKVAAIAPPTSSDIINIWKDRQDVKIYSSERYPPWLLKLLEE